MDYEQMLNLAKDKIQSLSDETTFMLRELFEGTFWNAIPKGQRLELGRRFKDLVNKRKIASVEYIGKAENNSALYIIKKDRTQGQR